MVSQAIDITKYFIYWQDIPNSISVRNLHFTAIEGLKDAIV